MRLALAVVFTAFAAAAAADTANMRRAKSTLEFLDEQFRKLDIDGDGRVSKAEAAGNAFATLGFDRADRNRDGKLTFAEYDSIGKPRPQKKGSKQAKASASASAGGTKAKAKEN
jgi:hypothetical protein